MKNGHDVHYIKFNECLDTSCDFIHKGIARREVVKEDARFL